MSRRRQADTDAGGARAFWDTKARENAMYYIHSELNYSHVDEAEFWSSGPDSLDRSLDPFGLTIGPQDQVVEIGCGIGRMTRAIAERAAWVTGIDVSSEMVERGRRALADLDNVQIMLGNGYDLGDMPDASADIAYSLIVFQHIPDPAITCGYIREIGRVLRPGGWTVFQVSQLPDLHRPERWSADNDVLSSFRRLLGRAPKGMLAPEWLGSALTQDQLLHALGEGGLVLDATLGENTQFCTVHAHRPSFDE